MPLIQQVGQRPYPVARRDLQNMLLAAFKGEVKLDRKCIAVEEDESGVTAMFENGDKARGDLLVAADGVRSILRTYVLGREVEPKYGGYINWNGLVPADEELAPKNTWAIYVGEHKTRYRTYASCGRSILLFLRCSFVQKYSRQSRQLQSRT